MAALFISTEKNIHILSSAGHFEMKRGEKRNHLVLYRGQIIHQAKHEVPSPDTFHKLNSSFKIMLTIESSVFVII